ncbi:flagellar filament capping protein FliD [Cohnella fermenti]|uniref:Flagellar hook-associated protein 2 n=1 Tax=Cohnella fermenti TaxID=2565925 RepID=A0A4S4C1G4_9BACL|nr:flagellar filament capping protein FliD [Cohnella fermenti]THF80804.1 hypothetical protein E6C55_09985 [Cohnella fermenti]
MAVSSVSSSSIAMTGLFSDLDTDSIVSALMAYETQGYTRLQTRQTDYEAQQELFRTINTNMSSLKSAAFNLTLSTSLNQTTATSSDTTKFSVASSSGAKTGTYSVVVNELAQSHTIKSANLDSDAIADIIGKKVEINDQTVDFTIPSGTSTTDWGDSDYLSFIKKTINNTSGIGVTASIVQTGDSSSALVLTSNTSGENGSFTVKAVDDDVDSATAINKLGWDSAPDSDGNYDYVVQKGQDASLTVNGIAITSSTNTIKNPIEGVTLTLASKGSASVTVGTDTEAVTANVQSFVDAYNAVIDSIAAAQAYTNSDGRTVLKSDSTLISLKDQLYDWVNAQVGQTAGGKAGSSSLSLKYLLDVGLEVDKGATSASDMTGKLSFDTEKFQSALESDPDGVYQLFAYNGGTTKTSGIFKTMNSDLNSWTSTINGTIKTKLDGFDSEISFISDQMEQMKLRLDIKEAALKQKYANMETSLSELQSTQSWLTSVVASMTNS